MIYLFWTSVALLLLTYLGYPLLLSLAAAIKKTTRFGAATELPSVALIISAYNEEKVIADKLKNSLALDYPPDKLQIIVVSDGSTDATNEIVRSFEDKNVKLIVVQGRGGKTHALNEVLPTLTTQVVVFSDANSMYHSNAIKRLTDHFNDPKVGAVCGELVLTDSENGTAKSEGLYWRYEQMLKKLESKIGRLTTFNGAIYALRRELHKPMFPGAANDFQHALQLAARKHKSVYEPNAQAYEESGDNNQVEFRRRVRIIARGWYGLTANIAVLNPFNVGFFTVQIICHKLLRWLGPVFMLLAFISNIFLLDMPLYQLAFIAQAIFYLLAILGKHLTVKPMAFAHYFCLINWAALLGFIRFLRRQDASVWVPTTHSQKES
ncbi:MAG: glycosyltransferase family 2 protein [Firmicutes bacterium]|nr:glycosyltransferase family 2 protein [Bacillota bacterium]